MLFLEAMEQLKADKAMHRAAWSLQDGYLKLLPGMGFVWKIVLLPNPNAGNYIFSVEDFLADDWQEFVMPKEVIVAISEENDKEDHNPDL